MDRMRLHAIETIVICLASLCLAGAADAQFYKWVDENGQVHFSDTPKASKAEAIEMSETRKLNVSAKDSPTRSSTASPAATAGGFRRPKPPPATRQSSLLERRNTLRKKAAAEEKATRQKRERAEQKRKLSPEYRAEQKKAKTRAIAIERCERLGMRNNCDSDKMVEKFRDLTPAEQAARDERRARARERDMKERQRLDAIHRQNLFGPQ